jgi:hypothetical protein
MGLALATKFAAVILVPVAVVLLALGAMRSGEGSAPARTVRLAKALALLALLAVLVVEVAYLFPSDPLVYWKGMRRVNADHRPDYAYYLMERFRTDGWWYYFLVAFLVKTPIPALAAVAASLYPAWRRRKESWLDDAFLALPIVAFTTFTSALADNLGIRYLLPVYPLLFVFAGRVGIEVAGHRGWTFGAVALGAWYVGGAAFIYPNHLAYFNEAAGGPGRGHLWLDDSNIDWGEGLPQLKAYLDREGIDVVRLHYGGTASPAYHGIRFEAVTNEEWSSRRPPPGIYAVSTHLLVRGEYHARRLGVPTNWLTLYRPVARVGYGFYIFRFE